MLIFNILLSNFHQKTSHPMSEIYIVYRFISLHTVQDNSVVIVNRMFFILKKTA